MADRFKEALWAGVIAVLVMIAIIFLLVVSALEGAEDKIRAIGRGR